MEEAIAFKAAAPIDNRVFVLILQHPRERRNTLATAELVPALLRRARLAVGLSWAHLSAALGQRAQAGEWAVLYLGSAHPQAFGPACEIVALDRHGAPEAAARAPLAGLKGIVLLDGTWKEAKTLWWRNPWLGKLRRLVLNPRAAAHYGRVRREPRREALSTLEAAALALRHLENRPEIEKVLLDRLDRLIGEAPPVRRPAHRRVSR
jgi:DTW domain-containing protein YfiP